MKNWTHYLVKTFYSRWFWDSRSLLRLDSEQGVG
jgi:hypothetical protein